MEALSHLIRKARGRILGNSRATPTSLMSREVVLPLAAALSAVDFERLGRPASNGHAADRGAAMAFQGVRSSQSTSTDTDNRVFWDELCGSQFARSIGVVDRTSESLKRFDDWYLRFYPYLDRHLSLESLRGRRVLEVGLGYGTVAQRIAEHGAEYVGLDIAAGPVSMVRHRLAQCGLAGQAVQGSILSPPLETASFDAVIAIGSLHHTGDLRGAIHSCRSLLRPGGRLTLMVYYAYSYRQAIQNPREVLAYARAESCGYRGVMQSGSEVARGAYDRNADGAAAPHTAFISRASLRALCDGFGLFECNLENVDRESPFEDMTRQQLLESEIPRDMGLDLYATAIL
jgi:SAM-dependent methyltransferase